MHALALASLTILGAGLLTACSSGGSGIDASCDVAGVTDEVEHIISDSDAEMGETVSLTCAEGWSAATVVVVSPEATTEETFIFRGMDGDWVLTSLVEACDEGGPLAAPEAARALFCAA